jgi:hypothetical protein
MKLSHVLLIACLTLVSMSLSCNDKILNFNRIITSKWHFLSNGGIYFGLAELKSTGEVFIDHKVSINEQYW